MPPSTPGPWREAEVVAIEPLTARIRSFRFALDPPIAFAAGQHVDVRLTAPDGYRAQRSYSIASAPGAGGGLELAIERLDDGEVSPFFHDVVAVGDIIELRGPIGGHFVWGPERGTPLLAIGGGSGLVPLVAMVRERALRRAAVPALLFASARTWDDIPFRDELLALEAEGLRLMVATTRASPRRPGDHGRRVDAAMMAEALAAFPGERPEAFVCGTNGFVEAAAQGLIAAGLPVARIRTERYGG